MEKECLYCKKLFTKKASCSLKDWNKKSKYCSQQCYWKSIKGKKTWSSTQKGIHLSLKSEFKKGMIPWNKGTKGLMAIPWNKKEWITKKCLCCGKEITIMPYRMEKFKFCSHSCRAKHNLSGVKHWNFKNWKTNKLILLRNSKEYTDWRKQVLKRDSFTCQECGQIGGKLHVDHIKPFAYFPEERFKLDNGRTLCIECHKGTDTFLWRALKYKQITT
jgi:hypothetical protein